MAFDLSSLLAGTGTSASSGLMGLFGGNASGLPTPTPAGSTPPNYLAGTVPPPRLPVQVPGAGQVAPGAFRLGALGAPGAPGNPVLTAPQPGRAQLPIPPGANNPLAPLGAAPGVAMNPLLLAAIRARLGNPQGAQQQRSPGDAGGNDLLAMLMGRQQYEGLF